MRKTPFKDLSGEEFSKSSKSIFKLEYGVENMTNKKKNFVHHTLLYLKRHPKESEVWKTYVLAQDLEKIRSVSMPFRVLLLLP